MLPVNTFQPAALAQQAMGATQTGSWLNIAGTAIESIAQTAAMGYQSNVAANNAKLAMRSAADTERAGEYSAEVSKLRTGELVGEQRASQAANNIDVNSGSAKRVQESTQAMGNLDAQMIRYNAARAAFGEQVSAQSYKAMSRLGEFGALTSAVGGGMRTYASYLAGSQALTNQRLLFGQSGVPNG